jgi:signal transduction histidine kinase
MLNTLMDISEAESGAMKLTREPVPMAEVVARAVDLYRDVAEAKGVSLVSDVAPGASQTDDVIVTGDRTRLEQVAANLLDNAVKYTPAGGEVHIEIRRDGETAVLKVRDTGQGIPSSELPRIFDRLFRGDASRTERGLGLGLSLVKAIVEAHGGTVLATSEVGKGSTLTVNFPT